MRTDINGVSTTKPEEEQWEEYYDKTLRGSRVQYDYRTPGGKLFSCIAPSLEKARAKRDQWLRKAEEEAILSEFGFSRGAWNELQREIERVAEEVIRERNSAESGGEQ